MENNIKQSKLDFSCEAGSASVNVYNGKLLFGRADINIGANNFAVGVSHIYGGQLPAEINLHIGTDWKLNIQQYKTQNGNLYLYTDENGYTHEFEKYFEDSVTAKYFDRTGLGLTLYVKTGQCPYIEDAQGGQLYFDGSGNLTEVVSAINSAIVKKIAYNTAGQIISIYDNRKPYRRINFSYNENNLLSHIECIDEDKIHHIIYYSYNENNNLISLKEYADGTEISTVLYKYDNSGRLKYAVRNGSDSALKFEYDDSNRIAKISSGVMKIVPVFDGEKCTASVSNSTYTGQIYSGEIMPNFVGFKISDNDADFNCKNYTEFQYNSNSTTVTNEKGIAIEYFFNAKGITSGILERRNDNINNLMTLTKDSGKLLFDSGSVINNSGSVIITSSNPRYILDESIHFTAFSRLKEYISSISVEESEKIKRSPKHFVVSFWAKLPTAQTSDVKVNIKTSHYEQHENYILWDCNSVDIIGESFNERSQFLDHTAADVWQYVTIPVFIETYKIDERFADGFGKILRKYLLGLSLEFEGLSNSVIISNLRIAPSQSSEMLIEQTYLSETTSITYTNNLLGSYTETVNSNFFMTEKDLLQTYRNIAYRTNGKFDLVVNNGAKRISNVIMVSLNSTMLAFENNIANYSYLYEGLDSKTETTFQYLSDRVVQKTEAYAEGTLKSSETASADLKGKLLEKINEYGVKTTYNYDTYGNPTTVTVQNTSGGDALTYQYVYDQNENPVQNEHVNEIKQDNISSYFTYNNPKATLKSVNQLGGWAKEYKYDSFDRLTGVYQKDGNIVKGQNQISYDAYGRIARLSDCNTFNYNFNYNQFGDITEYNTEYIENSAIVQKKMLEKEYVYNDTTSEYGSKVKEKIYLDNNTVSETVSSFDKYGKPKSINNNAQNIAFIYQSINESPSIAKVSQIYDPYENRTYNYNYDEENRPCGYNTSGLTVTQTAQNKTLYNFDGTNYETEIVYDADKLISPRIAQTKYKIGIEQQRDTYYTYDSLGRLSLKLCNDEIINAGGIDIVKEWRPSYNENTNLISNLSILYDFIFLDVNRKITHKSDYSYAYDQRGNVTEISEEILYSKNSTNKSFTRNLSYSYDGGDKVETEVNSALDLNCRYVYNERGQIKEIWNRKTNPETLLKTFSYDLLGRLENAGGATYGHNNYGNTISINEVPVCWARGRYLSSYNGNSYEYNYQGVRFRKTVGVTTTTYFLDGSKILGENRGSDKLRYFYDATGLAKFSFNDNYYSYAKDALGNITKLYYNDELVCHYYYDAWGNCKILDANGNDITNNPGIAVINPFRWKGYYFDTETGWYYIDGRYYDPSIGQYIDADLPENLLFNLALINGLNRYGITVDNAVALVCSLYSIFTEAKLYTDPTYIPTLTFWEKIQNWWGANREVLFVATLLISVVLMVIPTTSAFGVGMFTTAMGFGISGAIMGGVMGGIAAAVNGENIWEGISKGIVNGFMDGFITGAVFYCVAAGVKAIASAANSAKAARSTGCTNTAVTQDIAVQPKCFKEGTLVQTEDGAKPIEDIKVGDKVLAYNEDTGEQEYKEVVRLFRNETLIWQHVKVKTEDGEEEIVSTPGHKYYLPDNKKRRINEQYEHASYVELSEKWVSAQDLRKGDKVLLGNGKYGIIISNYAEILEIPETTYNFEVVDFHTYYVGENGVCVHNANCVGNELQFANKGSTGKAEANNLYEQLAMKQVQSNPLAGSEHLSRITMGDSRWLASEGWLKMQNVVTSYTTQTTIHFVYNPVLGLVDDFKFIAFKFLPLM